MAVAAATRRRLTAYLREDFAPVTAGRKLEVDRTSVPGTGIIKRVKVLGRHSKNRHDIKGAERTEYLLDALARGVPLFEGLQAFADHPPRTDLGQVRDMADLVGVYHHPVHDDDGIYADLHVPTDTEHGRLTLWVAEHEPTALKISQNAQGAYEVRGGVAYITEITQVLSADVVTRAGTTTSLAESESRRMKQITSAQLAEMGYSVCEEEEAVDGMDHQDHLFEAFKKLKEEDPEKANKLLKMLQADTKPVEEDAEEEDKAGGKEGESAADKAKPEGDKSDKAEQEKKAAEMKESLRVKVAHCERLCKLAGVKAEKPLLESLALLPDENAMILLEGLKTSGVPGRGQPPRKDPPGAGGNASGHSTKTAKDQAKFLLSRN